MLAAVYCGKEDIQVKTVPVPEPSSGEVLSVAAMVSGHRYSALAAWSPPARQNGSLPRRR
jgi:NADPH:quinone reductase-like Zn-dependent oxidoreductase